MLFWDAMIFCNNFANMITNDSRWCDVLVFWDAMIFCNNFARWLQKIVAFDAMRCVGFSGMLWSFVTTLCSPNEDFGRPNQHFRVRFRSIFQRLLAQIVYSHPWKVLRKRILKCWFGLPKSSFGMGKVVTIDHSITDDSYAVIKRDQPDTPSSVVFKLLGERWKAADADTKANYAAMHAESKVDADEARRVYTADTKDSHNSLSPSWSPSLPSTVRSQTWTRSICNRSTKQNTLHNF